MEFGCTARPTASRTADLPALGILQYLDTAKSAPFAMVVAAEQAVSSGIVINIMSNKLNQLGNVMLSCFIIWTPK